MLDASHNNRCHFKSEKIFKKYMRRRVKFVKAAMKDLQKNKNIEEAEHRYRYILVKDAIMQARTPVERVERIQDYALFLSNSKNEWKEKSGHRQVIQEYCRMYAEGVKSFQPKTRLQSRLKKHTLSALKDVGS